MTVLTHARALAGATAVALLACAAGAGGARADDCPVTYAALKSALVRADDADSTGLNNHFWAVVVNRSGTVCAVAYSGPSVGAQWLLSRQIAAAKAFTANGLSLDGAPISTAMLYPWVQGSPSGGNPLFGLAAGNPLDGSAAFEGDYAKFGTAEDPMIGKRVGGTITFGGGLGLYNGNTAVGGIGLSGDTACADHSTAFRARNRLAKTPTNVADKMIFGDTTGHPHCPNDVGTAGVTVPAS